MILKVIASGSKGNSYALISGKEILLIEAGVPLMEVKKAIDFQVSKVVGCIVSHVHGDHSKGLNGYERIGFPTFKPYESDMERQVRTYGGFVIKSFKLEHNVPCFGFLIEHEEMGKMVFATDTQYIKYRFKGLNHIMIEANYDKTLISKDEYKQGHVLLDHMEIGTSCGFLKANDNPDLRTVTLLHLSEESSDEVLFRGMAESVVDCPVYIADKGLEVELVKEAF